MTETELKRYWLEEEKIAYIKGWDFSHISGRYKQSEDYPWDYRQIINNYLTSDMDILDYDTGGGEFLLSLNHPFDKTWATEGYAPNVALCKAVLTPLGIHFKACQDPANIPFEDESFDMIINRHGSFDAKEIYRLLKKGGIFISQQVGCNNDRDLVEMVLPGTPKPFNDLCLDVQKQNFIDAGFIIINEGEVYKPIKFFDIGAFVWFARIIQWEFPSFSVEKCFDSLLKMQKIIDEKGEIEGTVHRYLIVARKGNK